ncbi:MAG TPA: EamA family transporter [Acidimicrobiales bacterium]|nr:EamA family transporter [Acidimicrobiales bacterium]
MDARRASFVAVAACVLWGTIPLLVRKVEVPTVALVFSRVGIAAVGLGVLLAVRRRRLTGLPAGRSALAAALLAVHWSAQFAAYRRLPVAVVILVIYLSPVGMAVLARRLLGERVERRTAGALGIALVGFVVIAAPEVEGPGDPVGLALAVFAAATYALVIVVGKPLAQQAGAVSATFVEMAGAAALLAPLALAADWGEPRWAWGWLVVLGLVHTAAATAAYLAAVAVLPTARAGVFGYLEPASAVVLGWAVLGQRPTLATAAGGLLIVAAGIVVLTAAPPALEVPTGVPR